MALHPKMRPYAKGSLSLPQVRMILQIYWTDYYTRKHQGYKACSRGIRERLARKFGTNVEVIKKVISIKHNIRGKPRRRRYPTIALQTLQTKVRKRLQQTGVLP